MNLNNINCISDLYAYSNKIFQNLKKKKLVLLVNLQNPPYKFNLEYELANKIECFTDQEYNEIIEMVNELELEYIVYYDELSFIHDVLENVLIPSEIIVINFARNGVKEGKKSLVPCFCDLLNIVYTGSGAFTQSLCRNKFIHNKILHQLGIVVPQTYALTPLGNWMGSSRPQLLDRIIIKPIAESSSIGISKSISQYATFNEESLQFIHNQAMIFQEYIDGDEVECPFFVFNEKVIPLPVVQLKINNQALLDEDSSSNNEYTFSLYNEELAKTLYPLLDTIVSTLNIRGYGRIDFRINKNNEAFLFDIATMPFICKHSSFNYAMQHLNYRSSDIFKIILCIATQQTYGSTIKLEEKVEL